MTFGFEARLADGTLQVSSDDPLFALAASGSFTFSGYSHEITIPAGISSPMVFVKASDYTALININGTTVTLWGVNGATVDYKVFAPAGEVGGAAGWGIAIYDAAGDLTYHFEPPVLSLKYSTTDTRDDGGFTITHGITDGYVCLSPFCISKTVVVTGAPSHERAYFFFGVKASSATQITAAHQQYATTFGNPNAWADPYDGLTIPILICAP